MTHHPKSAACELVYKYAQTSEKKVVLTIQPFKPKYTIIITITPFRIQQ
uniref:Uncharacterized protein n=1 Tax=Anguilla anguilla TaxID=7936 RepID=A0A0E9XXC3_ANGAN